MGDCRRPMLSKACALALLAVFAVAVTACGSSSDGGTDTNSKAGTSSAGSHEAVKVCFFEHGAANTWFQAAYEGSQAAAKQLGGVTIIQKDGKFDPEVQAQSMQDALATKECNAWMIGQLGPAAYRYAEQAIAKGIKVCGVLVPLGSDAGSSRMQLSGETCATYRSPTAIAHDIAGAIKLACKGIDPCEVGYLKGLTAIVADKTLVSTLHSDLADTPSIKIVAEQEAQWLADPAYKVTQNMLQAHPGLDVIASSGDQMTLGAERAVKAAGKTGAVKLIGSYGSQLGVSAVKAKRWFADTVTLPYTEGEVATKMLAAAVRKQKPPYAAMTDVAVKLSNVGPTLTPSSIGSFKAEWKG